MDFKSFQVQGESIGFRFEQSLIPDDGGIMAELLMNQFTLQQRKIKPG